MSEEKEWRCDPDQLAMLRRCSEKKDMTEWNEWRKNNPKTEIWLQKAPLREFFLEKANFNDANCEGAIFISAHCEGAQFFFAHCEEAKFTEAHCEGAHFLSAHCEGAIFYKAHCEGAYFLSAHCEGADFIRAHCEGADFIEAHCEGAYFSEAHCEGAHFQSAHCEGACFYMALCKGADFNGAFFNGGSVFLNCMVDDKTDFSNTGLSTLMMEPGKKAKLEQNIRRMRWEEWYEEKKQTTRLRKTSKFIARLCLSPVHLVRFFWYISDYGYSTTRIIRWFFYSILFFTILYTLFPSMLAIANGNPMNPQGLSGYAVHFFQMGAFATSTMVTLGFSNINVAITGGQPNFYGMMAVTANLMFGYFMLAVLVTRMTILFQTLGPGYVVPSAKDKKKKG